jgi:hypothetical protein
VFSSGAAVATARALLGTPHAPALITAVVVTLPACFTPVVAMLAGEGTSPQLCCLWSVVITAVVVTLPACFTPVVAMLAGEGTSPQLCCLWSVADAPG